MRLRAALFVSLSFVLGLAAAAASGQGLFSKLKDPEDGAFDVSDFLASRTGFLPVPIIITEPAVGGIGGGLAPVFIKRNAPDPQAPSSFPTPTIFGAAGFYTANGSWGGGAGYLLPFAHDRFRWAGGVMYAELNLKFYGFGPDSPFQQKPVPFAIKTAAIFQRVQARVGTTDLFVGLQYLYLATKTHFDGEVPPEITPPELDINVGGLGGMVEYDTRDNFLSPTKGIDLFASGNAFEPAFGSDSRFGRTRVQTVFYGRPSAHWGYGLRLEAQYAWGDMPFFMRPALSMRGLTGGKYIDKVAVLAEAEPRYWIDKRWMLLAFGGVGRVAPTWSRISDADNVWAAGFGFRYLIARKLGLQSGIDFGFGPSGDKAFYIQFGSAWR